VPSVTVPEVPVSDVAVLPPPRPAAAGGCGRSVHSMRNGRRTGPLIFTVYGSGNAARVSSRPGPARA